MTEPAPAATKWFWHTSNSWRRLMREERGFSRSVLVPVVHRDGHPDLVISDDDMALIAQAPALLELAERNAAECAECNGTGIFVEWTGIIGQTRRTETECPACKHIRDVIAKAKGKP